MESYSHGLILCEDTGDGRSKVNVGILLEKVLKSCQRRYFHVLPNFSTLHLLFGTDALQLQFQLSLTVVLYNLPAQYHASHISTTSTILWSIASACDKEMLDFNVVVRAEAEPVTLMISIDEILKAIDFDAAFSYGSFLSSYSPSGEDRLLKTSIVDLNSFLPPLQKETVIYLDDCSHEAPKIQHMVLGGTFDQLHVGHKALLYLAALCSTESLTIGVSTTFTHYASVFYSINFYALSHTQNLSVLICSR
jgi:hypothetical protein